MDKHTCKLIDRATAIFCASCGALAVLTAAYQLLANGVFYWHIALLAALFFNIANVTRKEARNG